MPCICILSSKHVRRHPGGAAVCGVECGTPGDEGATDLGLDMG